MSRRLDEKALEAAHVAYERYGQSGDLKTRRVSDGCMAAVVQAYLAALPPLTGAPVAYAYVVSGECEEIGWGAPPIDDPSTILLYAAPLQVEPAEDVAELVKLLAKKAGAEEDNHIHGDGTDTFYPMLYASARALTSQSAELLSLRRKVEEMRKALESLLAANDQAKGGLSDSIDNHGVAYQSQWLADIITDARALQEGKP